MVDSEVRDTIGTKRNVSGIFTRERKKIEGAAVYPFPFGTLFIGYEGDEIVRIKKAEEAEEGTGEGNRLTDEAYRQIMEYFSKRRREFDFPFRLCGTEFQKKVWRELCKIPYGETRSYKEIAAAIGKPLAYRAVGMANHKNPILIAVPCHRVIGADGSLVGYADGVEVKRELLFMEGALKDR